MNRSSILRSALPIVGVLLLAACGPRMKPVEYEEPTKDLSSSGEGASSDEEGSSSSASSALSSADSTSSSSEKSAAPSSGGSCKEKKCGEVCTECPPGDASCMEVVVLKQCNTKGDCVPAPAECTAPKKEKK